MLKNLEFIALIPNEQNNNQSYTAYLIQKQDKIVLPLDINAPDAKGYLSPVQNHNYVNPSIHNTIYRILIGLGIKIKNIIFYKFEGNNFYSYLNIEDNKKNVKINISPFDSLIFAKISKCPILIKDEILNRTGIKITTEILNNALFEG